MNEKQFIKVNANGQVRRLRKRNSREHVVYCDVCGAPLCEECGTTGLCSACAELWESEIDLEDREAEQE